MCGALNIVLNFLDDSIYIFMGIRVLFLQCQLNRHEIKSCYTSYAFIATQCPRVDSLSLPVGVRISFRYFLGNIFRDKLLSIEVRPVS